MKILIVYASYSGSTYLVSQLIAERLSQQHEVTLKKVQLLKENEMEDYEVILLGSTSWDYEGKEGLPHSAMVKLVEEELKDKQFSGKKFAIFGCGDKHFTHFCGAVDYLEQVVKTVNGQLLIKSLKIDQYYLQLEKNQQQIAIWVEKLAQLIKEE